MIDKILDNKQQINYKSYSGANSIFNTIKYKKFKVAYFIINYLQNMDLSKYADIDEANDLSPISKAKHKKNR